MSHQNPFELDFFFFLMLLLFFKFGSRTRRIYLVFIVAVVGLLHSSIFLTVQQQQRQSIYFIGIHSFIHCRATASLLAAVKVRHRKTNQLEYSKVIIMILLWQNYDRVA